jgi:hypothetical protein
MLISNGTGVDILKSFKQKTRDKKFGIFLKNIVKKTL